MVAIMAGLLSFAVAGNALAQDGEEGPPDDLASDEPTEDVLAPAAPGDDQPEQDCVTQADGGDATCPTSIESDEEASSGPAEEPSSEDLSGPPDDSASEPASAPETSVPSTPAKPSAWVPPDLRRPFEPGR